METAIIAFVASIIVGIGIYISVWWDTGKMTWTFTKWYFGIIFLIALICGGYALYVS
ncbi:hypothetical protein [Paenibacillus sp. N3.4]|uniref:hypothetical protein n=1 Tax=Paenibacillus sp. N3.4 TaxID=2603222 RepID=UPI00164FE0F7|nr:hypothetical protein [Paenibacillus sp. N3.4]